MRRRRLSLGLSAWTARAGNASTFVCNASGTKDVYYDRSYTELRWNVTAASMGGQPGTVSLRLTPAGPADARTGAVIFSGVGIFLGFVGLATRTMHPHGGQFHFVWLSARTPHGAYVW